MSGVDQVGWKNDWAELWKGLRNKECKDCGLYEEAQAVCLIGQGPVPCDFMVVGEAPGKREDDIRKPFAGKAGAQLDIFLREVGLDRSKVFITNVVKCKPPDNRAPTKKEIKSCAQYLQGEMERVKPKYVLLLGNTALQAIGKSGIKKHKGKEIEKEGIKYLATYHPAYILRQPGFRQEVTMDFKRFSLLSQSKPQEGKIPFTFIKSRECIRDSLNTLEKVDFLYYDIETMGGGSIPLCLGIHGMTKDGEITGWFIPLAHPQSPFKKKWKTVLKFYKKVLEKKKCIGQFAKFDNVRLKKLGIKPNLVFDTGIAAHILNENSPNSLDYLVQAYLGLPSHKESVDRENLHKENIEDVALYNMTDTYRLIPLHRRMKEELAKDKRLLRLYKHSPMAAHSVVEDMEVRGMYIDIDKLNKAEKICKEKITTIENELKSIIPNSYPSKEINWNSPKQIADLLFSEKGFGLEPLEFTKTGQPSTGESILKELSLKHEAPEKIIEYRTWSKRLSTYIEAWKKEMDSNQRIRCNYRFHGTVTGRLSSRDPNLQNVPREPLIRSIISAPPGYKLILADYSQIELRILAHMSGDSRLKRDFQTNQDVHTLKAADIMNKDPSKVTKHERKMAKAVNFGFAYGMSAGGFMSYSFDKFDLKVSYKESEKFRKRHFSVHPQLLEFHRSQIRLAKKMKQVRSTLGRVRRLPDIDSPDDYVRAEAERKAINAPVQAVPPDLTFMVLSESKPYLGKDLFAIAQVHDEIIFECKEEVAEKYAEIIKNIMENLPLKKKLGVEFSVPIKAEVRISDHWE